MNLGKEIKEPTPGGVSLAAPTDSKEPKISYPDFTVRDEAATKLLEEYSCDVGEEIAATVRLKVSGRREDEYGKSITFEVLDLEDMAEERDEKVGDEADAEEPDDEEKVLGYKRNKSKKETPSVSAKDLSE
jgi:hypothetical protein